MWRSDDLYAALWQMARPGTEPPDPLVAVRAGKRAATMLPGVPADARHRALHHALDALGRRHGRAHRRDGPRPGADLGRGRRARVAVLTIVGDAFARPLLDALDAEPDRWSLASLRAITSSGVTWSPEVKRGLLDHLPDVTLLDSLGASEGLMSRSAARAADADIPPARFAVNERVRVLTDDGREVAPGSDEIGMVGVGGRIPLGYYKDPEKTATTFRTVNGVRYSIPGDYATVDPDGTIRLLGRGSATVNTGGEKVYPEEVELVLRAHPAVDDCVVVGRARPPIRRDGGRDGGHPRRLDEADCAPTASTGPRRVQDPPTRRGARRHGTRTEREGRLQDAARPRHHRVGNQRLMADHFVIDGSNLATEGRTEPSLAQLREAVAAFKGEHPGSVVTVVVDASFEHRIDPSERPAFAKVEAENEVVSPPAGAVGRGDGFLLQISNRTGATVVSNDSFQEFHAEYEWLFEPGRLIGGKPVPGVGWIFSLRRPVRGIVSRKTTQRAKKEEKTEKQARAAIAEATHDALTNQTGGRRRRRGGRGSKPAADTTEPEAVNQPAPFLQFVIDHRLGTPVDGVVDSFSSHGAFVVVDDVRCYVPLGAMGDPRPTQRGTSSSAARRGPSSCRRSTRRGGASSSRCRASRRSPAHRATRRSRPR